MRITKLILSCSLLFLLLSCTNKPVDTPTVILEEYAVEYDIDQYIKIPKYLYTSEEVYDHILVTEPVDLTLYADRSVEFTTFQSMDVTYYVKNTEGNYVEYAGEKHPAYFKIPSRSGEYMIITDTEDVRIASHIIIGDGVYKDTIELDVFSADNPGAFISLSQDTNGYQYYINDLNSYFRSMVISKEDNDMIFFQDFNYIQRDGTVIKFRNGNEIQYNNEVYYIEEAINLKHPAFTLINSTSKFFYDILETQEIISARIINPISYNDVEYIDLDADLLDEVLIHLSYLNYYEDIQLIMGAGGIAPKLEVTTLEGNVYVLDDSAGSLCVNDEKWYTVNSSIWKYLENIIGELK
ncbi:MAG: hypothetical protein E7191_05755 [Erysipelotrichaceae bacterium]|nr:hypothetical protein [Erysipelotrichaceae bacterium]